MSGDHNEYQKDKSYLDFECPRCGHCCQAESFEYWTVADGWVEVPYTTPQKKEWKGLTDEEIDKAWRSCDYTAPWEQHRIDIARAIEQALKEKILGLRWIWMLKHMSTPFNPEWQTNLGLKPEPDDEGLYTEAQVQHMIELLERCENEMRYAGWDTRLNDQHGRTDVYEAIKEFLA